jgi:hypothetical protein
MAPVPSTTGTIRQSTDIVFNTADDPVDITFDCGSDSDRLLIVSVTWDGASGHVLPDGNVLYNSVAMTAMGATISQGNARKRSYYLVAPSTGSNTLRVDPTSGAGDEDGVVEAYCYSGVNQDTPVDGYTSADGLDSSNPYESAVTITSAVGDLGWFSHGGRSTGVTGGTVTGFTERLDNVSANIISVSGDETGAASIVTSVSHAGPAASLNWIAHGININAVAAGPIIDDQPTAQTVVLNNDSRTAATFVCTAMDDITDILWELETSVGGGVYAEITDGGIYDITDSFDPPIATLVITPVNTALSGRRVRVTLTDAGGTTTSNAVALTVLNGPILSAYSGSTNASGVATVNLTSDDALTTNGEVLRITFTAAGVTKRVYVRPA